MAKVDSSKDSSCKKFVAEQVVVQKAKIEQTTLNKIEEKKEGSWLKATEQSNEVKEKTPEKSVEKKRRGSEKLEQPILMETVIFGTYGGQKIDWIVLEKKRDKALLFSRVSVGKYYFRDDYEAEDANKWAVSDIRSWLNKDFLKTAFSLEEQKRIIETRVSTDGCADTKDRIFLLSIEETKRYFKTEEDRQCILNGVSKWWWLRSPGCYSHYAAGVREDGSIFDFGYVDFDRAVLPALWITLKS